MVPEKMVYLVVGLNPRPLSHESSTLTTRPWLLALYKLFFKKKSSFTNLPFLYSIPTDAVFSLQEAID